MRQNLGLFAIRGSLNWDKIGITLSSLCLVHCMVTPLLILVLPALDAFFDNRTFHIWMAAIVMPVALFAFIRGYLRHREPKALLFGTAGTTVIVGSLFLPHEMMHDVGHVPITVAGSLLLIFGHLLNRRYCRRCH